MTTGEIILAMLLLIISLLLGSTLPWLIRMYGRIIALETHLVMLRERVEVAIDDVERVREGLRVGDVQARSKHGP